MEIITIPLKGILSHQDSTGAKGMLEPGDVQRMTAGTGIIHSEFNGSKTDPVEFLQIWILPNKRNVIPKYDQKKFAFDEDGLTLIVSSEGENNSLDINQNSKLWIGKFGAEHQIKLPVTENAGIYIFVIEGNVQFENKAINRRDAIGVYHTIVFDFKVTAGSHILIIQVPMS
jgi:redox-sensitive bicupin YhaK (pirin superfamily)